MARVLVIEDDRSVRGNLVKLLTLEGFDAICAANGAEGVQLAVDEAPDLILCDILMPGLNGYQVLSTLRDRPSTATIPVLFVTGLRSVSSWEQALAGGAEDYLTKPYTREAVLAAIAVQLEKQQRTALVNHTQTRTPRLTVPSNIGQSLFWVCGTWGTLLGLLLGFKVGLIAALVLAGILLLAEIFDIYGQAKP